MIISSRFAQSAFLFALAASISVVSGRAGAVVPSPMNLQRAPLFLNASVDPNVVLTLDDSGSMGWPYMPDGIEGGCGFRHPRFFSHVFNRIYYNPAVPYTPPLAADGAPFPNANFNAAWLDGYEAPGSPKTGTVPTPTIDLGTSYFPKRWEQNANTSTALFVGHDPRLRPVAPDLGVVANGGTVDAWFNDCALPGTPLPAAPAIVATSAWLPFTSANNETTGAFFQGTAGGTSRAFYYAFTGNVNVAAEINNPRLYEAVDVDAGTPAQKQNFANWFSYYSNRYLLARTAMTRSFGVQDSGLRVAYQQINGLPFNPGTTTLNKFQGAARTAFFQQIYSLPTAGGTPNRNAMNRAGRLFRQGSPATTNFTNPYWEGPPLNRELTCRQNFHVHVTDGYSNGGNPAPPPGGWASLIGGRLLPDTKTYAPAAAVSRIFGNIAPPTNAGGCWNGSGCDASKATVAFTYWANDLRPDLVNNVPPFFDSRITGITGAPVVGPIGNPASVPEIYWNPVNDPATWQHMVNFTVGLGVSGVRVWPTQYDALRAGTVAWPGFRSGGQETVDDFWHAGLVSRGGFFSAANPEELVDSLSAALSSVLARSGTAAATSVTSGIIQAATLAFRSEFDSGTWSGDVSAFQVGNDAQPILPAKWKAGAQLTARTPLSRNILTAASASGGGIAFQWGVLPAPYQVELNDDPSTSVIDNDGLGARRLEYIRGARNDEIDNGGPFRIRSSLLGAVIGSGAAVIAAPSAPFVDEDFEGGPEFIAAVKYEAFRATLKNRRRVVYVGANDGMLHAFDAGTGVTGFTPAGVPIVDLGTGAELWAYVPREVGTRLSRLTNPTFEFTPYVDATPVVQDAFIGGRWRTLLVGSLRRGGQGVFALDVTNPNVTEADASNVVLWEVSDDLAGFERLGFTFGRPNIARLANGKWVVLVPGGYNSEQNTMSEPQVAPADADGGSTMFVLDAATGALIRKFEFLSTVSRGLTSPTMGDYELDYIAEFAVAGDLQGNLWRFDLADSNPINWSVDRMFSPTVEFAQPITAAPRLFGDPATGGIIAVVGTGKYLEAGDRSLGGVPTQSFYGIRDYGKASGNYPIVRADLTAQTFTLVPGPAAFYTVTNNAVPTASRGWRINLPELGERVVNAGGALFSQGIVILSSIIPSGDDPCEPGLRGSVFVLNAAGGGAPLIDLDGDGQVAGAGDLAGPVGRPVDEMPASGTLQPACPPGEDCRIVDILAAGAPINVPSTNWRRRSWREIQ